MSKTKPKPIPKFQGKLQPDHRVVFAFESGGIRYFKFDDSMAIPCGRSFEARSYYDELSMRCERDYLKATMTSIMNICKSKEVNIIDIWKLANQTLERLDYIFVPDQIYKIASIVYFDETENPYKYDFKYGNEKIQRWKKENVEDFFLSQPIRNLLPQNSLSVQDLPAYLMENLKQSREQITEILSHLSASDQNKDFYRSLKSQLLTT